MRRKFTNFKLSDGTAAEMATLNGVIVGLGPDVGEAEETVDLGGKWVAPSFNDSHCHILPTGLDLQKLHLGSCSTHEEVLDAVRGRLGDIAPRQWLHAVHYDQTKFPGAEHLDRDRLDAISSEVPILLRHSNGHASVANSAALVAAGVSETTEDPAGGTYVRDAAGRMTGVLLERAHEYVTSQAPEPTLGEMVDAILLASEEMSKFGITAASDMMTGRWHLTKELEAYRLASERGAKVRFTLWMQWATVLGPRAFTSSQIDEQVRKMDPRRCAIGGVKIFADGAIGSATAAIYGRYETDPGDGRSESGQLIYNPSRLTEMVVKATQRGYSVAVHAIGDRAVDVTLNAFETSGAPARHRLEHAMILSDAQIERLARVGCFVTMQPEFLHRFGHAYKVQLGAERASKLKRARSVLDAGLRVAFDSDRPIVLGDPVIGIQTAVSRPEGFDPAENVSPAEAFRAYTLGGAEANRQDGWLGSLEEGFAADFGVYEENPVESISRPTAVYLAGSQV